LLFYLLRISISQDLLAENLTLKFAKIPRDRYDMFYRGADIHHRVRAFERPIVVCAGSNLNNDRKVASDKHPELRLPREPAVVPHFD